ncbi:MAG: aminotransferase class III-fold pyridoxal phosphate-dependent enzyme, partial [Acetobacteraceae bacterium]|nr:aminotransferase class III-fold pyridoxal phosphate-dependent enzyme [Acetobacteraceae bacterium]
RAFRRREKILKFEGGYHGMSDYGLMSLAPKRQSNFPRPVPDSAGIPRAIEEEVLVAPYNDLDAVQRLVAAHGEEIAGIIVEPFQRLIPPAPGFLAGLRDLCTRTGIVLIFDEVVTGFRFSYAGAQGYYGVTPDLCSLGKIIGGGFPLAAIAGRTEIMSHFDRALVPEDAFLTQIGTLSGNPVAAVAGLKTLEILRRPGMYERAFATGRALWEGIAERLARSGLPAQAVGEPPLFDVVFAEGEMRDYRAVARGDRDMAAHFNRHLRAGGILKGESKYYLSTAHEARDVEQTLAAWDAAIAALPARRAA